MVLQLLLIAAVVLAILLVVRKVPLSYNLRNLTLRWKTTAMTALAFTAVIAVITVMMAFVHGMNRLTQGSGRPGNVLIMADGATDEAFSNLNVGDLADIENLSETNDHPGVVRERGRPLASRETYMVINQPVENARAGRAPRRFLQVRGLDDPRLTARVHDLGLLPGGRWFTDAGAQEVPAHDGKPAAASLIEAVLGEGVARELGRDRMPEQLAAARNRERLDVGDTFAVGNRTWIVCGVLASEGSTFGSEIWAKRSLAAGLFGKETYTTLVVRTRDAAAAEQLKKFLVEKYEKARVAAQVETDYYASLSETNKQFAWTIGFVAVVMSVGGVFGVMNTMFAAIRQRNNDIGVLRLLGYSPRQILISFLLESLVIALVGGLLGCALGMLCDGWSATSVVSGGPGSGKSVVMKLAVDADTIATGILLTLGMGTLGGVLPALSAMRLSALEALR